ncbi:MAG: hypothetical protein ACYS9X_02150 [Planctomycetota bacterium]
MGAPELLVVMALGAGEVISDSGAAVGALAQVEAQPDLIVQVASLLEVPLSVVEAGGVEIYMPGPGSV